MQGILVSAVENQKMNSYGVECCLKKCKLLEKTCTWVTEIKYDMIM